MLCQREWRPKSLITLSAEYDSKANNVAPKLGLALALKPWDEAIVLIVLGQFEFNNFQLLPISFPKFEEGMHLIYPLIIFYNQELVLVGKLDPFFKEEEQKKKKKKRKIVLMFSSVFAPHGRGDEIFQYV